MPSLLPPLSARSEAITRRTYNRPLDDNGSKFETWKDTILRSHHHHHVALWEGAGGRVDYDELQELVDLGLDRSGLVSGRTLWLGGTEYGMARASSNFNCTALNLETVFDMVDAMWLLLNGCGVGGKAKAGTLHGYYRRIPTATAVPSERHRDYRGHKENRESLPTADNNYVWTIVVGDSAEAWAKAPGKMLSSPRGRINELVLDFSNVRGPGGRLKGYGWICNGYSPLAKALLAIHDILNRNSANLLNEEDILDIFNWFGTVLSSRRAAESGLMDEYHPLVEQFATRKKDYWKNGNEQRAQSNNSILFWSKPDIDDIADLLYMNLDGGEPGFVNASAALSKCSWFNTFNPCQPGFATVLTPDGIKTFDDIDAGSVIWSGSRWTTVTKKWATGTKPVYKYTTTAGEFVGTDSHRIVQNGTKVMVGEADAIDACYGPPSRVEPVDPQDVMDGWVLGDGTVHARSNNLVYLCVGAGDECIHGSEVGGLVGRHRPAFGGIGWEVQTTIPSYELPHTYLRQVPDRFLFGDSLKVRGFLRGLYAANGSVCGGRVTLKASSFKLIKQVQTMLSSIGIASYHTTNKSHTVTFANGDYKCRESYDLNITTGRHKFSSLIGFVHPDKVERLATALKIGESSRKSKTTYDITSQECLGDMPVYDITVEADEHTYWTGGCLVSNCFEICLPSHGFCNLVSVSLPSFGRDFGRLERAVWVMARANYRQTCVSFDDGLLQARWGQTNESLRLCGVSFTGIVQAGWLTDYQIRRLRNSATLGAYSMADELQMPRPKAITTIKPEGTRSKISGRLGMEVCEGIHSPLGRYIFNWINFSPNDPLVGALEAAGYRTMPNPNDSNNVLVRFPVDYAGCNLTKVGGKLVNTESAVDQLERYRRWNVNWADHNVSATISLDRSEVAETAQWIHDNWDDGYLATAFLQRIDPTKSAKEVGQPYLPQEVVEEDAFNEAVGSTKPVDWDRFHTGWHEISDSLECAGGVCPTK